MNLEPVIQSEVSQKKKNKSKLHRGITSHWSEWPSTKYLQTINAGEDVEERGPSCAVGGNAN